MNLFISCSMLFSIFCIRSKIGISRHGFQENLEEAVNSTFMKLFKNWKVIWTPRRERGGGMDWEIGIDIYTLLILCIK